MFWPLFVTMDHMLVETSLEFRGNADKKPAKKGLQPIINKSSSSSVGDGDVLQNPKNLQ